jgi:hypothetical protein
MRQARLSITHISALLGPVMMLSRACCRGWQRDCGP